MAAHDEPLTGSAAALAKWFTEAREVNGPEHDEAREEVLNQAYEFYAYGVHDKRILLATPRGRVLIEPRVGYPGVVDLTYAQHDRFGLIRFWMNASSLSGLGEALRAAPEKRQNFASLLIGGDVKESGPKVARMRRRGRR